jgi:hypothetical protein
LINGPVLGVFSGWHTFLRRSQPPALIGDREHLRNVVRIFCDEDCMDLVCAAGSLITFIVAWLASLLYTSAGFDEG